MRKIHVVLLLAAFLLFACTKHYHTERFGYLDPPPDQKNIIMPAESSNFTEELKEALRAKGWNTLEPVGQEGGSTEEKQVAPYTLLVQSRFISKCVTWDNFVEYDISLKDNRTGKTLFTMAGQRCDSKVVHQFMSMLEKTGSQ